MHRLVNASDRLQPGEDVALCSLDVIHMMKRVPTSANEHGYVAIGRHLSVWDFLHGGVYGVEEGCCLI